MQTRYRKSIGMIKVVPFLVYGILSLFLLSAFTSSSSNLALQTDVIADFETTTYWKRGPESYATLTQSQEQVHSGVFSGKIDYNFPADNQSKFVAFFTSLAIPSNPTALSMWVHGDGSQNFLNAWVKDANGQIWQYTFGQIHHSDWQKMTAPLSLSRGWPNEAIDNPSPAEMTYPLELFALILDSHVENQDLRGTIFIDDISISDGFSSDPSIAPSNQTQEFPPVSFYADQTSLNAGACTTLHWSVDNVDAVYLNEEGQAGNSSKLVCPTQSVTYTLKVVKGSDSQEYQIKIIVQTPEINFYADSYVLIPGQCTSLRWDIEHVKAIYLDDQGRTGHDSQVVCPNQSTIYVLRIETESGTQDHSIRIEVESPVYIEFYAGNDTIRNGDCTLLYWYVENARNVYISNEEKNYTGEETICPTENTAYLLEVETASGNAEYQTVEVNVIPAHAVICIIHSDNLGMRHEYILESNLDSVWFEDRIFVHRDGEDYFAIKNCGSDPLVLNEITIADPDSEFWLYDEKNANRTESDNTYWDDGWIDHYSYKGVLLPGKDCYIRIVFTPFTFNDDDWHQSRLYIYSNSIEGTKSFLLSARSADRAEMQAAGSDSTTPGNPGGGLTDSLSSTRCLDLTAP